MSRRLSAEIFALCASGALLGAAHLPSAPAILAWVLFVPVFWVARDKDPLAAFLAGTLYYAFAHLVGIHWLAGTTMKLVEVSAAAGLALFAVYCAYHGTALGFSLCAARWLARTLARRLAWAEDAVYAAALIPALVCAEGFFPRLFPGSLAETQFEHLPNIQSLELFGTGGIAWLVAAFNAGLFLTLASWWERRRAAAGERPPLRWGLLAAASALVYVNAAYGRARMRDVDAQVTQLKKDGKSLRAAVVQGAVPHGDRFVPERLEANLSVYNMYTRNALLFGADFVAWPQNSYERTLRFANGDAGLLRPTVDGRPIAEAIARDFPYGGHVLMTGPAAVITRREGRRSTIRRHRVSILKGPEGEYLGASAKRFPTPIGEYMPLGRRLPFLYKLVGGLERIRPGPQEVLRMKTGAKLGAFICYDGDFPVSARDLARKGAELLINPTSDEWYFDKAIEPLQHQRLVSLRAIENRRFLLRPVTSGISAIIDPVGRVVAKVPMDTAGTAFAEVALLSQTTLYTSFGDCAYELGALILGLMCFAACWVPPAPGGSREAAIAKAALRFFALPLSMLASLHYRSLSRTGAQSQNEWIAKSSEIDGWLFAGEHEFLWELAVRPGEGHILEIGSWMGKSTCILAGACKEKAPETRVFCLDSFDMKGTALQEAYHELINIGSPGTFYEFIANAKRLGFYDWIVPIPNRSDLVLPLLPLKFRLVFIDGGHAFEDVKRDVSACLPKLSPGGLLVLHDAQGPSAWPGIRRYLAEELSRHPSLKLFGSRNSAVAYEKIS